MNKIPTFCGILSPGGVEGLTLEAPAKYKNRPCKIVLCILTTIAAVVAVVIGLVALVIALEMPDAKRFKHYWVSRVRPL